jgi:hypothetical protein
MRSNGRKQACAKLLKTNVPRPFGRDWRGSLEDMVRIEAGAFHMGSESAACVPGDGEGPVRRVTLSAFYVSKYAVRHAGPKPRHCRRPSRPPSVPGLSRLLPD